MGKEDYSYRGGEGVYLSSSSRRGRERVSSGGDTLSFCPPPQKNRNRTDYSSIWCVNLERGEGGEKRRTTMEEEEEKEEERRRIGVFIVLPLLPPPSRPRSLCVGPFTPFSAITGGRVPRGEP